jgi:hypothetical protein
LGSHKRPAVVRVRSTKKGEALVALCSQHDWQVIVGIEENEPEDTSDVDRLLSSLRENASVASKPRLPPQINPNDYCPSGSGKKFKKCCGAAGRGFMFNAADPHRRSGLYRVHESAPRPSHSRHS